MIRKLLLVLPTLVLLACPKPPVPGPKSPYDVARGYINDALRAVPLADIVFDVWAASVDPAKAAETRADYARVKKAVIDALYVALAAVDIAESQNAGLDLDKLFAQAEAAWQQLRKFLEDIGVPATLPASLPRAGKHKPLTLADLPVLLHTPKK